MIIISYDHHIFDRHIHDHNVYDDQGHLGDDQVHVHHGDDQDHNHKYVQANDFLKKSEKNSVAAEIFSSSWNHQIIHANRV